jgi:hypothetical protein
VKPKNEPKFVTCKFGGTFAEIFSPLANREGRRPKAGRNL